MPTYQMVRLIDLEMAVAFRSWNNLYYNTAAARGQQVTIDYNPRSIISVILFLWPTCDLNIT